MIRKSRDLKNKKREKEKKNAGIINKEFRFRESFNRPHLVVILYIFFVEMKFFLNLFSILLGFYFTLYFSNSNVYLVYNPFFFLQVITIQTSVTGRLTRRRCIYTHFARVILHTN